MTWLCTHTGFISIIILIIQLFLIWGQLRLSKKINNQSVSREKGLFLIEESNIPHCQDNHAHYIDSFNLLSGIGFYVSGNCDVIICRLAEG